MAGFVPLVSSFTAKPSSRMLRIKSGRSRCSVGSPPVTATPSRRPRRFFRKASSCSGSMASGVGVPSTREALWQKGQRKLQPPVKTVHATLPGKSSSVIFCRPMIRILCPSRAVSFR